MMYPNEYDLIRDICGGFGSRFNGVPCSHYDSGARECCLLNEKKFEEILNQRCTPFRYLRKAVEKELRKRGLLRYTPWRKMIYEADVQIGLPEIWLRLMANPPALRKSNLIVFYGYLRTCAYMAVIDATRVRKKCGKCKYFQVGKCWLEEGFEKESQTFQPNPYYGQERNMTDEACSGFVAQKYVKAILADQPIQDPIDINKTSEEKDYLDYCLKLLEDRRDTEEVESKQWQIWNRRIIIFIFECALGSERDIGSEEINREIDKLSEKMLQREKKAIREYLLEKMSSEK